MSLAEDGPRPGDLVVGPWGRALPPPPLPLLPRPRRHRAGGGEAGEGDGASPAGAWRLLWLYWWADRGARPATPLPAVPLGPQQGWAEDPNDPAYNRPIRHPHPFPVDRMARGDRLYDLCAITDHNVDPVVPGAGSAIFLHLWRRPRAPSAGCIAFRRRGLGWILARWRPASRLVIRTRGGL